MNYFRRCANSGNRAVLLSSGEYERAWANGNEETTTRMAIWRKAWRLGFGGVRTRLFYGRKEPRWATWRASRAEIGCDMQWCSRQRERFGPGEAIRWLACIALEESALGVDACTKGRAGGRGVHRKYWAEVRRSPMDHGITRPGVSNAVGL